MPRTKQSAPSPEPSSAPVPKRVLNKVAREHLGYESLRPDQEKVVRALTAGHDVLAVIPTGGGKSAIYQLAGVLLEGTTVVVSPLIALQADQVEHIEVSGLPPGEVLNSHTTAARRRAIFDGLAGGSLEYLLLAPEQLASAGETLRLLKRHPPGLFVVDEAHCVSEWGHDFRPDFRQMDKVLAEIAAANGGKRPRVLALTATASPTVQRDILKQLGIEGAEVHVAGFDRPNIDLRAEVCPDVETKDRLVPERIRELARDAGCGDEVGKCCGIVYVATHAHTESVKELLAENNLRATTYHGGMTKGEREARQAEFMRGEVNVMVATSAFGMGVDKPDVRWVLHYDVPDSLDNYYQQVGRAGRDGGPAVALLLYREADLGLQKSLSSPARLDEGQVADVIEAVREGRDLEAFAAEAEVGNGKLGRTLQLLEEAGAVTVTLDGEAIPTRQRADVNDLAEQVVEQQQRFRDWRQSRLDWMRQYAVGGQCRRWQLLSYFGESDAPETCAACDNCRAGRSKPAAAEAKRERASLPYAVRAAVEHAKFGRGVVEGYEGDKVNVLFEKAGRKQLVTSYAVENKLLTITS